MMERIRTVHGIQVDIQKRQPITRNDIEAHTALFQRDIEGLFRRNIEQFRSICFQHNVVGDTDDELWEQLVELFRSETHYKRRNKLRARVTKHVD
ncbi:MAG: hypothetical protein KC680_00935 [Candidatus Peregrinibacteria bacterium]|nr:hypothetical protein [Candidatus Peregrinibacteria bacterium]MCB9808173.1 hypothetical protein [Candidatus Peribacteria bacterium]